MTADDHPAGGLGPGHEPEALVDGTAKAWQMTWTAATQGSPCNATPTTPVIQLSFARTRIREIDLRAGLLGQQPEPAAAVPAAEDLDRVRRPVRGP